MKAKTLHYIWVVASITIPLVLCILIASLQYKHDRLGPPFTTRLKIAKRNLLPPQILPYVSFGFNNILADIYWIRAIQDFVAWNGKETFFISYFKNITTLDPRFEYPYLFAILAIPQNKDIVALNEVAELSEKGLEAIPEGWQIPFYLGTQYYLFTRNYNPAERYLAIAATKKDAPDGVYLIYSNFAGKNSPIPVRSAEDYHLHRSLLKVIYNSTDNETTKKIIEKGLQEELIYQMIEKGIIAYKEKNMKYPTTVEEIIAANFIRLPEGFMENFDVVISQKDGSFKVITKDTL